MTDKGHNRAPATKPDALEADLGDYYADLTARVAALAGSAMRLPEVLDQHTAIAATDFAAQLRVLSRDLEKARKAEKGTYDALGKVVQKFFKPLGDEVAQALGKTQGLLTAHLTRENERSMGEARARRAELETALRQKRHALRNAEARVNAAAFLGPDHNEEFQAAMLEVHRLRAEVAGLEDDLGGDAPEPARLRGDMAGTAYLRQHWDWEVVDISQVPDTYTRVVVDDDMVRAEVSQAQREGREPSVRGLVFTARHEAVVVVQNAGEDA